MAALASSEGGQDSVDAAIRSAASKKPAQDLPKLATFVPFDQPRRHRRQRQQMQRGAQSASSRAPITRSPPHASSPAAAAMSMNWRSKASGFWRSPPAIGFPSAYRHDRLSDPRDRIRVHSSQNACTRCGHGHGDGRCPATAAIVAHKVGLTGPVCPPESFPRVSSAGFRSIRSILPEGKYDLVKAFQKSGIRLGCAAMAPMTHPRCARRRSALPSRRLPMWRNRRQGCTHPSWAGRHCCRSERGQGHVSAHSHLYAELGNKKDCAGAPAGNRLIMTGHAVLTPC